MPKNKVSEWSTTAASNTDIGGININEGCPPSGINNAIRELMAQVRDFQLGADGDGLTVSTLNATTATIGALTATSATVTSLAATNFAVSGIVSGLTVTTLRVLGETTGTTATFGNVTATQLNVSGSVTGTTATFGPVITDTISEKTSDAGVTIDGLLIKDGVAASATKLSTSSGSAPSYSARAWVNFNGTGTVAIRSSGNVTSITDNGVGNYTVNFTTPMDDANYSVSCSGKKTDNTTTSGSDERAQMYAISRTTTSFVALSVDGNSADLRDSQLNDYQVFR
jgi:hypothetical protein